MTSLAIPKAEGEAPIRVDWSHMPESQPEYWWARLNERELSELDDNQRLYAERMIRKLTLLDPDADLEDITNQAICEAIARVPTARKAAKAIAQMRNGEAYCYLAFCGLDGVARFMKVGMSAHPEQRISQLSTGNPMDFIGVYASRHRSRADAYAVEQGLLRSLSALRCRGEWIDIGRQDAVGIERLIRDLTVEAARLRDGARFEPIAASQGAA